MRYKLKFKKRFKNKTNYAIKYVNATSHDPLATDRNEDVKKRTTQPKTTDRTTITDGTAKISVVISLIDRST